MNVKLKVLDGKHAGQIVPVRTHKFLIGRAEDCQLRPGSDLVSRHHCLLLIGKDVVTVLDFNSSNGTFLNGQRLNAEQDLRSGDQLRIGPLVFEVLITAEPARLAPAELSPAAERKRIAAIGAKAATSGAGKDVDVMQWLVGDEPAEEEAAPPVDVFGSGDTQRMPSSPTAPIKLAGAADAPKGNSPTIDAPGEKSNILKRASGKPLPGKLPPPPVKPTKDTQEAAQNILQDLIRKRHGQVNDER